MALASRLKQAEKQVRAIATSPAIDDTTKAFLADDDQIMELALWLVWDLSGEDHPHKSAYARAIMTKDEAIAYVGRMNALQAVKEYETRYWRGWRGGTPSLLVYLRRVVIKRRAYDGLFNALCGRQQRAIYEWETGCEEAKEIQKKLPNQAWKPHEKTAWDSLRERCWEGKILSELVNGEAFTFADGGEVKDLLATIKPEYWNREMPEVTPEWQSDPYAALQAAKTGKS